MKHHSLDELTDALVTATPALDDQSRPLVLALYRCLAGGLPVSDTTLFRETSLPIEFVQSMLASWPGVFRNDANDIIGFWGLALGETAHQFEVNGVRLYAWCAWDTLFLPGILQTEAAVQSVDPQSGASVKLTVAPNKVLTRSPDQVVVSFLAPDGRFEGDVITSFCHYIHFFADPTRAGTWLAEHDGTFLLELDDAFELGRRWNAARGL